MTDEGSRWLYKNKDHGMMSAAASLGMIYMWNQDEGLSEIDKYMYSNDDYIKGGALLGIGIVNSSLRNNTDAAYALLSEHVEGTKRDLRIGAILGLGIAYAGTAYEEINELLMPILVDAEQPFEVVAFSALTLGLVFVGTGNEDITEAIMSVLMTREEKDLTHVLARFLCLALGFLFLGRGELAESAIEASKTLNPKIAQYCELTVDTCAYAGSGNVLKVQQLLKICGEHIEEGKENKHQGVAAIGIAAIAIGEELGAEMAVRSFDHLLQYSDLSVKRAVPLAIGLLNVSNPKMPIVDTLSKLSHDNDAEVAQCAILALGLIGAGSNNARIAQLLRQLSSYYAKEAGHLFMVRIAQGLLFMGKGLISLSPIYSDRNLMQPAALCGLLTIAHTSLDLKNTLLAQYHYLLYTLACAMYPRMLLTVDEDLNPIPVSVRVGTAVDTVAQAGRPKTITGFQTHNTPVILNYDDRAELATEEYIPLSSILEGVIILRKNPEWQA
jgi:26S proteasome regulatory subunit N1